MSVNVLFLEVQNILTNSGEDVLTERYANSHKLNFNNSFVKNLNKLIQELDLFIVFISPSLNDISFEDTIELASSAGIDNARFLNKLDIQKDCDVLTTISNYLQDQRHRVNEYFILTNPTVLAPSFNKNIYVSLTGFTLSSYTQCLNQFKSLIKEQELIKQGKYQESEAVYSKELKNILKEDEKLLEKKEEISSQIREVKMYLDSKSLLAKYEDTTKEHQYKDLVTFLSKEFSLLDKPTISKILKEHGIYDTWNYSLRVQLPLTVIPILLVVVSSFLFLSLTTLAIVIYCVLIGILSDLLTGFLYKTKKGSL